MEIDKTGLDGRIFSALAGTSKHLYLYLCNLETNVSRWSPGAIEYFGLPGEYMEDAGNIWAEHIHPEDRELYRKDLEAVISGKKYAHELEYRARNRDGSYVVCTCRGVVMKGENGEPDLFAGTIRNHGIIDNVDPATSLYNIYEFMDAMRRVCANKEKTLVMMVGINQFGNINNVYGYVFGNKVLRAFGHMLKDLIRGKGMVYRMDGSRFALCLRETGREDAIRLYEEIRKTAHNQLLVENTPISLSVAGGVVEVSNYGGGEYPIRSGVTCAFEQSKQDKHGDLVFFDDEFLEDNRRTLEVITVIRQSITNSFSGFYMCYQPLVEAKTGKITGMEALLRWKNEKYGEVSPGVFIPWLEKDPCFYELGRWIMTQALKDALPIVKKHPDFIVNVNVSYAQIEREGFRDSIMEILQKSGFPTGNLCLELTERCRAANKERLKSQMGFFGANQIKVAMDDFGTGAASLNLLRELPMYGLKIDRTFISSIQTNRSDQVIVETVISCARQLGIRICLEGVENKEIKDYVMRYDAEFHQGYYYSRPVRMERFMELLQD